MLNTDIKFEKMNFFKNFSGTFPMKPWWFVEKIFFDEYLTIWGK